MKFFAGLGRWWFGYGSPVEMGLFRLVMGFWIFVNQLMVGWDFDYWFTERGFVPVEVNMRYLENVPRLNLIAGVTDSRITLLFYIAVTLAAFTTCIGLWTRISSIVLALGIISLHHRNAMILHGGDLVIRMGAIYIALAPSGAACSVDRLIKLWRGQAPAIPEMVSLWPQRLVQFQVALVYFTTVWHKWFGTYWRDGTATWYPLHLKEFERFWLPDFMREGIMIPITTYGTLLAELGMCTLVFFKPWRKWAILAAVGMHLFIEYAMNIPLFSFLMITTYLAFFEGEEISAWARRVGARFRRFALKVWMPAGTKWETGPELMIKATDPFVLVNYQPGNREVWSAEDEKGNAKNPFRASSFRSIGSWGFAWIPGVWKKLLNSALARSKVAEEVKEKVGRT